MSLTSVSKHYGTTVGIDEVSLDIADGEFFVLLGPSGSGKTTTLKSVAGLVDIDGGSVSIAGRDMTGVEPYHRNVAMAFESYALYPQKTVEQNLSSPLRSGRTGRYDADDQRRRVEAVTTTLGIDHLLQRFPRELSNGQRQRTSLGRVLVRPADVYLLDEPLSHLDAKLRAAMRRELKQLGSMSSTTTIYVTHDYQEALALGDRVGVLRDGRMVQVGPPEQIWNDPVDTFVARTLGQPEITLLDGVVEEGSVHAAGGALSFPVPHDSRLATGSAVRIGIRPRDLQVDRRGADGSERLRLEGTVRLAERLGRAVELDVRVGDTDVVAVDPEAGAFSEGDRVSLSVPLHDVHLFAAGAPGEETPRLCAAAAPTAPTRRPARTEDLS